MSFVAGVREREKMETARFIGIEARMLEVQSEEGAKLGAEMRERAYAFLTEDDDDAPVEDECDDLDLDPESPVAAKIIDDKEFREAEQWYASNGPDAVVVVVDEADGDE